MSSDLTKNPFSVQSPEHIAADDVISLFVEDFADFHQVLRTGHTFLHGARGSGKSMIFRYLEPDCQSIAKKRALAELEFYSFYIPIKETELRLTELLRLEKERHGSLALNEHLMVVSFAIKMLSSLQRISSHVVEDAAAAKTLAAFVAGDLARLLRRGGWNGDFPNINDDASFSQVRQFATNVMEDVHAEVSQFIQRLSLGRNFTYEGALLGFLDFMKPFTLALRSLPFMPKSPIFLLIDDADNLSEEQTRILNTWISSRGVAELSLKVSTQLRYKTYRTVSGQQIEMPHDFAEVEISNVYTSTGMASGSVTSSPGDCRRPTSPRRPRISSQTIRSRNSRSKRWPKRSWRLIRKKVAETGRVTPPIAMPVRTSYEDWAAPGSPPRRTAMRGSQPGDEVAVDQSVSGAMTMTSMAGAPSMTARIANASATSV